MLITLTKTVIEHQLWIACLCEAWCFWRCL